MLKKNHKLTLTFIVPIIVPHIHANSLLKIKVETIFF